MLRSTLTRFISSSSSRTPCSIRPTFFTKKLDPRSTFLVPGIRFQTTAIKFNQPNQEEKIPAVEEIKQTITVENKNNQEEGEEKQFSKLKMFTVTTGIGVAMGIFGGMVGLGGGVIAIPLLVKILNLSQHRAHATTLAAITSTGFHYFFQYFQNQQNNNNFK